MPDQHLTQREQAAYELGKQHALNAASWIIDANTKPEFIPAVLAMFDAGDPSVDDYLPARPDLSGQWADSMTPSRLADECGGWVAGLCDAYEAGVAEHFDAECERLLREAL
jgi:hypothetical protein